MTKNPFINALAAALYITLVVFFMQYAGKAPSYFTILAPIAILSLLTLSVAIMAYLFFFRPVQLYLDGKKKQGAKLFLQTLGSFGIITVVFIAVLLSKVYLGVSTEMGLPPVQSMAFKENQIVLYEPAPDQAISSPLKISGKTRGNWYFEATFPVILTDWDGLIIAEGYATAEGDWMTEDFVPFTATLEFTKPAYGERGSLILKKDNPSGLPEYDDALEIPVRFK